MKKPKIPPRWSKCARSWCSWTDGENQISADLPAAPTHNSGNLAQADSWTTKACNEAKAKVNRNLLCNLRYRCFSRFQGHHQDCASNPSNYFDARTPRELVDAFERSRPRLTGFIWRVDWVSLVSRLDRVCATRIHVWLHVQVGLFAPCAVGNRQSSQWFSRFCVFGLPSASIAFCFKFGNEQSPSVFLLAHGLVDRINFGLKRGALFKLRC